jgi:hypothetical protein
MGANLDTGHHKEEDTEVVAMEGVGLATAEAHQVEDMDLLLAVRRQMR